MFYNFKAIPQRMALKLVDTDSAENRITNNSKAKAGHYYLFSSSVMSLEIILIYNTNLMQREM